MSETSEPMRCSQCREVKSWNELAYILVDRGYMKLCDECYKLVVGKERLTSTPPNATGTQEN